MDLRFSRFEILTGVGALFLCVLFVAVFVEAPRIQEDLAVRAAAVARDQNLYWSGVAARGQRVVLTGRAADEAARARAVASVHQVPGITAVEDRVVVAEAGGSCQAAVDAELERRPITFEKGRPDLSDAGMAALDAVAAIVGRCGAAFEVASHTDAEGDAAMNLKLSQRRAETVVRHLARRGVDPHRLRPAGYGEAQPVAHNHTDAGRSANQRLEFRVLGEAA
jgi:OOP family OmpA-OmpF porin